VKAGLENIKSVLPTRNNDNKEKDVNADSKSKSSSESIKVLSNTAGSPTSVNQSEDKLKTSKSSSNTTDQEEQPGYEPLWQISSQKAEGRR
jgi:sensor domain CHASE-containing protein